MMTDSDFLRKLGLEEVAETAEELESQFRAAQISQVPQALTAFLAPTIQDSETALAMLMSLSKEQFFELAMEMLHDFYHQDHNCRTGEEPPSLEEMEVLMMAFQKRLS